MTSSAQAPPRRIPALGRDVGAIGLGCMGLSWGYGDPAERDDDAGVALIRHALDAGVTFLDTSDVYGAGRNESLVGRALAGRRGEGVLATKCGLLQDPGQATPALVRDGRPEHLRAACDASLRRLGVDVIDLYYLHRVDPAVPLADSWGTMADLVTAGKVRALGLSEVTVAQADEAHRLHPVAAVQSELSLWTRDALGEGFTADGEPAGDVVGWTAAHDAIFVPFAPLGRGFLTGALTATGFGDQDLRSRSARFAADAAAANQRIVDAVRAVAVRHGATPATVALAWVLGRGAHVIPIPGTTRSEHLAANLAAASLPLDADDLADLDRLPAATGARY